MDLKYFIQEQRLRGFGGNIKCLGKSNVLEEKVYQMLDPKFDKNGWKYKLNTWKKTIGCIVELYRIMLNEIITLEFAHNLVAKEKESN